MQTGSYAMTKVLAVLIGALAACASPAQANVTGHPDLVNMAWEMSVPAPKNAVLHYEPCPNDTPYLGGCAFEDGRVFVEPLQISSPLAVRMLLFHELGHRFHQERPWVLRRFDRIMHGRGDSERFASAYDNCARDQESPGPWPWVDDVDAWNYGDGYQPYKRTHRRVCRLIRRAY